MTTRDKIRKLLPLAISALMVLSLALIVATTPVSAAGPKTWIVRPITLESGGGSATWTTDIQHTGVSSVKLTIALETDYAELSVPVDIALENLELENTSFWCKSTVGDRIPYFIFVLETDHRINNDADSSAGYSNLAEYKASKSPQWQDEDGVWRTWAETVSHFESETKITSVIICLSDWPTLLSYVDDLKVNNVTYELEQSDYNTIQAAITAAGAGDTVLVYPGIYAEDLVVNTANLTLKSESGKELTTIQLVDGVGIDIQGGASNFTLGGAEGKGFAIVSSVGGTTFDIQLANAPSGVEISYNAIDTTGHATMGISVGAAGATGLTIDNNTFTGDDSPDGSIWGPNVVDITVTNNTLDGVGLVSYGIQFSGVTGTSTISNNTIENYKGAGGIVISNGAGTSGLTISNNDVSESANGIRFSDYCAQGTPGDMTTVTVVQNILTNNAKSIRVGDGAHVLASDFTIENNNIAGSTTWGLQNEHATEVVTATLNWWDSDNGPSASLNTFNVEQQGDSVSANIDFTPWLDAPYPEGDSFAPVKNADTGDNYTSIQAAIDAASSGNTIIASDGTYTEDLKIQDKANLTLKSESGKDVTTIQLTGVVKYGIELTSGADNTTIGGEAGHGFTIKGPDTAPGGSFVISVNNAPSGVEISYNAIDTTGVASIGINIGAAGATNLTVSYNKFIADNGVTYADVSISGEYGPIVNLIVTHNEFTGPGIVNKWGAAISVGGVTESTISNNTIDNYDKGINIQNGTGVSDLLIDNNSISGCGKGVCLKQDGSGDMTTVTLTQNTLANNTIGLLVEDGAHVLASQFTIENNDIVGSTDCGLKNEHTSEDVTATYNWWGDSSGPSGVGSGEGDAVSTNVNYNPWLLKAKDEPQTYYDYTLALESGWNLISTPKILENENLSKIIVGTTLEFYTYDGNHWISTTSMKPLDAVFVKMGGSGGIGFEWTTSELVAPPTKQLENGWNIVGSSVNIPSEASVRVDDALDSVSGSWSTVFSPACNLSAWTVTTRTAGTESMLPYEGYWVYMLESAELAGRTT